MLKILIAEDEEPIANLVKVNLNKAGYQCVWAPDGMKAADYMMNDVFDLVLLDIMLPGIDGYELLDYAKKLNMPVIFLTALGSTEHKVKGLRLGADDYLPKPFVMEELLARIRAMLRRRDSFMPAILEVGDLRLDPSDVTLHCGSKSISLQNREFQLMEALMKNPGIYQSADNLIISAWGYDVETDANAVRVYLSGLRRHLEELGSEVEIRSRRNIGYTLSWK